ncbi:MAG: GAF domain-containing protein [Planctomycetota bacterium]
MSGEPTQFQRDYTPLLSLQPQPSRDESMRALIDALWNAFSNSGPESAGPPFYSWVGIYVRDPENPQQMVLGPSRDTPACSPIELHGACGRCMTERRALLIPDVTTLGDNYIACDPNDASEVVVPLLKSDGTCDAVLDVDSHQVNAFDAHDASQLALLLEHLGISSAPPDGRQEPIVL